MTCMVGVCCCIFSKPGPPCLFLQSILQTHHDVTEEDIHLPTTEQREPWTLPQSIFKARSKEADARAFYDGGAVSPCFCASLLYEWALAGMCVVTTG